MQLARHDRRELGHQPLGAALPPRQIENGAQGNAVVVDSGEEELVRTGNRQRANLD